MEHLFIPLPQRIQEIMKERGRLSQEYVATRIGIHRDTFRSVLRGERPIYGTELRKLVDVLKISVERLNQTDVMKDIGFLDHCLNHLADMEKALPIAEKFSSIAVGITERHDALNYLGRINFELKKYNEAYRYWLEAYKLAELIQLSFGDSYRLHNVAKNLMISYTVRKDFVGAQEKVAQLKPYFQNDPVGLATLSYSVAMIAFNKGDLSQTRVYLYESMMYFQQTGDAKQIGNAEYWLGNIEYMLGNLSVSRAMFEQAIRTLTPYSEFKLMAIKSYLKVLLKLGEKEEVKRLLHMYENEVNHLNNKELQTQYALLHMIAYDDPSVAKTLLVLDNML